MRGHFKSTRCRRMLCAWDGYLLLGILFAIVSFSAIFAGSGCSADDASVSRFSVYFNNDRLTSDPSDCSAVVPVDRQLPKTSAIAAAALQSLFLGPSPQERAEGFRSYFSEATANLLRRIRIESKTAYVDLADMRRTLSGVTSSCGSAEFRFQIERTLLQFPSIDRVVYAIEGNPRTFYEWMNEPCDQANDYCNPAAFRNRD